MDIENLTQLVVNALEDRKAQDIKIIDMRKQSNFTDVMIIACGTSNRQVGAIADNVIESAKHQGNPPLGVEGEETGEWILVDLGDVVVHVMQPQIRDFYQLEKLWADAGHEQRAVPA